SGHGKRQAFSQARMAHAGCRRRRWSGLRGALLGRPLGVLHLLPGAFNLFTRFTGALCVLLAPRALLRLPGSLLPLLRGAPLRLDFSLTRLGFASCFFGAPGLFRTTLFFRYSCLFGKPLYFFIEPRNQARQARLVLFQRLRLSALLG